uniref:Uncharacterized protein n=1 Tax=Serratia phage Kevin TaxID=3161161 RepID=A0AAU8KX46_9CAUD
MGLFLTLVIAVVLVLALKWLVPILSETWDEQISATPLSSENRAAWLKAYRRRLVKNILYHLPF